MMFRSSEQKGKLGKENKQPSRSKNFLTLVSVSMSPGSKWSEALHSLQTWVHGAAPHTGTLTSPTHLS